MNKRRCESCGCSEYDHLVTGEFEPVGSCAHCGCPKYVAPPYADPLFVPGMVVCAADREPDDCRIWEYAATGEGDFAFYELWRTDFDNCTYDREGLPVRLAVVGDDGKVKP